MAREKPKKVDIGFGWLNSLLSTMQEDPFGGLSASPIGAVTAKGLQHAIRNLPEAVTKYSKFPDIAHELDFKMIVDEVNKAMKLIGGKEEVIPSYLGQGAEAMALKVDPYSVLKIIPGEFRKHVRKTLEEAPKDIFPRPEFSGTIRSPLKNDPIFSYYTQPMAKTGRDVISDDMIYSLIDLAKKHGWDFADNAYFNAGLINEKPYVIDAGSLFRHR